MKITGSEQMILNLLWEKEGLSIQQMVDALEADTGWSRHAIISFLKKMESKGTVRYEEQGRTKYYYAVAKKEEVVLETTRNILDRFFGGKLGAMVSYMAEADKLTPEDVQELHQLLDKLAQEQNEESGV
ncbi:MAG: BlaI/MecI/CopY family transcriptional regulator [Lachnospiraceae bacterium]|nr:BlaI/MecI/CopY family transcriptional regulator [Lachnospiraceae bacterium]